MGKAFKGAAVVGYCKPLRTRHVDASGSALGVKSFLLLIRVITAGDSYFPVERETRDTGVASFLTHTREKIS